MRFDVPVIGSNTIEVMRLAGATCLSIEAGRTLIFDLAQVRQLAAGCRHRDCRRVRLDGETKSGLIVAGDTRENNESSVRRSILVVLLAGAALHIRGIAEDPTATPQAGQMAPDFTLPSQDGSNISLDSFRGKWVVLYFYPKDMTTGCTIEAHNFQQDMDKYQKLDAVVVGVSVDSTGSHKEFCAKEGLSFKLLSDAGQESCGAVWVHG